ncbi:hypothetical protein ACLKA6_013180 [Drosophila palustris]
MADLQNISTDCIFKARCEVCQCAHIVKCFDDPHMCIKDVEVSYTVTERVPLDAYEDFESVLRDLDVQGEMILVTKTKLEPREVCCDGYQRSEVEGEGCQPVPIVIPEEQDPIADAVDPTALEQSKFKNICPTNEFDFEVILGEKELEYECCLGFEGTIENCQPKCSRGCGQNSFCALPEICECLAGYEMDENSICVPKKDPNLCIKVEQVEVESKDNIGWSQLEQAFKELNLKLPTPYPSTFKTEIRHVCCDGYGRQTDDSPCEPLCSEKCDKNSFCSKPNVCECKMGYEVKNGSCQRLCEMTCTANSYCRDGKFCECIEGFEMVNGDCVVKTEHSKGMCPDDCGANSFCGESGLCECQMNYHVAPSGLCVKDTTEYLATDPHLCSIKRTVNYVNLSNLLKLLSTPGNVANVVSSKIEVPHFCCPGYEQKSNGSLCQPKCGKGCGYHCRCVGPETCQCDTDVSPNQDMCQCVAGYTKSQFGFCQPLCRAGCPAHSSCIRPEQCQCNEGYSITSINTCQPICPQDIPENGRCVRPGEWECAPGYIKLPRAEGLGFHCAPHCQESCFTFASCVAPNVCKCLPGYTTTTIEFEPNEPRDLCVRIRETTEDNLSTTESEATDITPSAFLYHPEFSFRSG